MQRRTPLFLLFAILPALFSACEGEPASPTTSDRFGSTQNAPGEGTLVGTVLIDGNEPAADVAIHVFAEDTSQAVAIVRTDLQGRFSTNVPPGVYTVLMQVPEALYPVEGSVVNVVVDLKEGETLTVKGFALTRTPPPVVGAIQGAWIFGEARVEGVGPVSGTVVSISMGDAGFTRTSDTNGFFDFGHVESGAWELSIAPPTGYVLADGTAAHRTLPALADGDSLYIVIDLATAALAHRARGRSSVPSSPAFSGLRQTRSVDPRPMSRIAIHTPLE